VLSVHAILEGDAPLWAQDPEGAVRLSPGDVMLVREDTEHHVAHASGAPTQPLNSVITPGPGVSRQVTVGHPHDGARTLADRGPPAGVHASGFLIWSPAAADSPVIALHNRRI
jgi:hypothetical protein